MLAIFPVAGARPAPPATRRCARSPPPGSEWRISTPRAGDAGPAAAAVRRGLHLGEILWGNIGAADRLDFTAIGPAVNLVSRLEGLCRPLDRAVLVSGAVAAEATSAADPAGNARAARHRVALRRLHRAGGVDLMIGSWTIGAQLSTSHSSPDALDPLGMLETVRRVQEAIDLDLLIVGFREAPDVFREFCGPGRPVERHVPLVQRPVRHRRHGGFGPRRELEGRTQPRLGRLGREREAKSRRPSASSARTIRRRARRRSDGFANSSPGMISPASFSTRSAFLRPPTASMKCCPAFATIAGTRRRPWISTSTLSSRSSPIARSTPALREPKQRGDEASPWLDALVAGSPILSRFLRFRADSVAASRRGTRRGGAAHGAEGVARPVLALPCRLGRPGLPRASSATATGRSR